MLDLKNQNFKTKDELRILAPSIFTETNAERVSSKYRHITTETIIDDMEKLGWGVVDAKEVKARKSYTRSFQKHLVVFRNPEIVIEGEEGNEIFPQILLTNSHDGKNAFTFTAGLFRTICENGIVISTNEFEKVRIRHMGYDFNILREEIKEMVGKLPLTVESMNKMVETKMSQKEVYEFAKRCLGVRFGNDIKNIKVNLKHFITPVRDEDRGRNLWNVFNVIQEKLIEGDFEYNSGGKLRKARRIKNFSQDLELNSKLFETALEYVN